MAPRGGAAIRRRARLFAAYPRGYPAAARRSVGALVSPRNIRAVPPQARSKMEVAVTDAKGKIDVAAYAARTEKNELVTKARIVAEQQTTAAEVECMERRKASEAEKDTATLKADARVAEAKAQGAIAKAARAKVTHEHQLRLATIDAELAESGRRLVSGKAGETILGSLVSVRSELMAR